jgi:RNA polymerase sigma factor (sigma-70 family)
MADTTLTMPRMALGAGSLKMAGDDRLADLAAAGDERAFTVIFERHHQALYRYCRSILGNNEDASDALQNTMLRALRALPGEKRTIALKPWLFRIAHNEAISLVRRRRPQVDVEDAALGLQSTGPEVDSDLRERVDRLFEDLKELPDRQRSALIMRELSGLSYDEIAAALRTSTGAATQAVFGARKALHEFAEGRDMLCEEIQREISRRDGRILASRKIRAHLRQCEECTAFRALIAEREQEFRAMAPPMPAIAAAAMLQGLQGGGGMGGGLTGLSGAATNHAVVSVAVLKAVPMLIAAAVGAGVGAIAQPDASRVTPRAEPAAAIRAFGDGAGKKAHAAAAAEALRTGVRAAPAAGGSGSAAPNADARAGTGPQSPAQSGSGSDPGEGGGTPVSGTPVARAPSPQRAPTRRPARSPAPQQDPAPESDSRPSSPPAKPKPTPAPTSPSSPPATQTPPAPAPTPTTPPPAQPGDGEPDDNTDDKPRKKPHPCPSQPPPRGHPDGPCPS